MFGACPVGAEDAAVPAGEDASAPDADAVVLA
jgi:hypothetical protein